VRRSNASPEAAVSSSSLSASGGSSSFPSHFSFNVQYRYQPVYNRYTSGEAPVSIRWSSDGRRQSSLLNALLTCTTSAKMAKNSAPTEVAPVPGFFGHVVKPGQPLKWSNEVEDFCMQLNSAALGSDATKGRSTLSVVAKTSKITLCTLTPEVAEQWNLTQTFTPMDGAVEFVVDGPNAIHLTGFIEVQDEEDSGDEHDFDDLDSDEEEMMVFGGDSDDDDVDSGEEEELNDEDKKTRFEVLKERLHKEETETKKKSPKKEEPKKVSKKEAAAKKAAAAAAEAEKKATDEKVAAKKQAKAAKEAEKEKKTAEKVAEATATNPKSKKRAAPTEAVAVPKKAKVATRVHKGVTIEDL